MKLKYAGRFLQKSFKGHLASLVKNALCQKKTPQMFDKICQHISLFSKDSDFFKILVQEPNNFDLGFKFSNLNALQPRDEGICSVVS